MEGSLARGSLHRCTVRDADDLTGIACPTDGLQSDIIAACAEYACKHRYKVNVPNCGVMVCNATSSAVVQAQAARITWSYTNIPRVYEYRHLGVIITPEGR